MSHGVGRIAMERNRQIKALKWTPEHDYQHVGGELAQMALVYIDPDQHEMPWPREDWDQEDDDHGSEYFRRHLVDEAKGNRAKRVEHLVKAGALIAAEIDRLILNAEHPHGYRP